MSHKVSEECIQVLKSLYEGKEFTPLKSKEDVQELLMGLSFLIDDGKRRQKQGRRKGEGSL